MAIAVSSATMEGSHNIEVSWQGQFISLIWIFKILVTSSANLPAIMVTSNVSTGEIVCPGDIIIFTCTTRGSAIISWTGNDYVGDQIGFNTANMIRETRQGSADRNTIATLINVTVDNTTPILVSQLRIIVSTISLNQSIICVHNNGIREPTIFQVIVDSGSPRVTAHLTGNPMRRCTLHISWIIPDITAISDITHFMIYIDGVNVYNQTNSNNETFLSLSYFVHSCSPHNVSISIVNSCGQVSPPSLTISIVSPEPIICEDTMCEDSAITGSASRCLEVLFAVLFAVVTVGMITSAVGVCFIYFKIIKKWHDLYKRN